MQKQTSEMEELEKYVTRSLQSIVPEITNIQQGLDEKLQQQSQCQELLSELERIIVEHQTANSLTDSRHEEFLSIQDEVNEIIKNIKQLEKNIQLVRIESGYLKSLMV